MPVVSRIWSGHEIEAGLRALVWTLAPTGRLPGELARLVAAVQGFLGSNHDVASLAPIDDATLAASLVDPWLRVQLVRTLVVGVLMDPDRTRATVDRIAAVAAALGVTEPAITDVALLIAGKRMRMRRHLLRRTWVADRIKARIAERGLLRTLVPFIYSTFFRRYRNRRLAARFATLRQLPDGTVGRAFLAYLEANQFPLPGERGAVSDIIVQHDLAHVLGGYSTTPAEEVLVACFSAGHRVKDPFAFIVFALLQFHLGVRMTPGAKAEVGYFDPVTAIAAIERGARMTIDLTADWDYWPAMAQPVERARRDYGVSHSAPRQQRARDARTAHDNAPCPCDD